MKDTRLGRADKNKPGLYENIQAKRERIKAGSGERMRKPGQKGAPAASDFKAAAKTAKPEEKEDMGMRSKYDKTKKGCDCQDGSKGSCKCSKKDMGMKKSPYADGCGYKEDAFARELDAVISGVKLDGMGVKKLSKPGPDDEDDRDDKKCGASGIADNKKCTKGSAGAAASKKGADLKAQALAKEAAINKPKKQGTLAYKQSLYGLKTEAFGKVGGRTLTNRQVRQAERGVVALERRTGKAVKLTEAQKAAFASTRGTNTRRYLEEVAKGAKRENLRALGKAGKNTTDPAMFAAGRIARRELLNRNIRNIAGASLAGVGLAALATPPRGR